jgi:ribose 5-phosphate isomerase A
VVGVPTSYETRLLAKDCGIPIQDVIDADHIALAIDGADEVDPAGNLIKGAGGAHVMEKLIATCAARFLVVVDESKLVRILGERSPIPIEVITPALPHTLRCLAALGGKPLVRCGSAKLGPVMSDLGHPIIDVTFGPITDAVRLSQQLNNIPGVVDHGLFLGMADEVIVARPPADHPTIESLTFSRPSQR